MSDLIVPIVEIETIHPHPNADKLEIVEVLGYQAILPKGQYKIGDRVVYFPADTLLTQEWAEKFGVANYLKGKDKNRVGRIRLRGEPSFGLVVDLPEELVIYPVGRNVANYFSVLKYEPPICTQEGDAAKYDLFIDPTFTIYTKIQNGRIFTKVFKENEKIVVTEKIHGMNNRVGVITTGDSKALVAGTHKIRRKYPEKGELKDSKSWFPWSLKPVENLLLNLAEKYSSVVLYGEVFGGSVQSLNYGIEKNVGLGYRAFDLQVDGKYLDYDTFKGLCAHFNVKTVPEIYRGLFNMEKIKELAEGQSIMPGAAHLREGVVVKPVQERTDSRIGRVILKFVSIDYQLTKKSDFTDV